MGINFLGVAAAMLAASVSVQDAGGVCAAVSKEDAIAVLGSLKQGPTELGPHSCVFTTEGLSLLISRLADQEPETTTMMLDVPKNRAKPGDVVKEEPGIGDRAVSEVSGGHLAIIVVKGTTVWTFGIDHVYRKDISAMLPKLRTLAQKAVGGR